MDTLTVIHVVISLIGILSGLVVMLGMLTRQRFDRWTIVFLATTAATSATGFFFPFHGFTPAIGVGILSLVVLAIAGVARYVRHLAGAWRWIYVLTATVALYFNCFVSVVQLFQKVPALKALAPTQSEPPFAVAQLTVLVIFLVLAIAASIRFRVAPAVILATFFALGVGSGQDANSGRRLTPSEINRRGRRDFRSQRNSDSCFER